MTLDNNTLDLPHPCPRKDWRHFDRVGCARHIARWPKAGRHAMCKRSALRSPLHRSRHTGPFLAPRGLQGGQERTCLSERLDKTLFDRAYSHREWTEVSFVPLCQIRGARRRPWAWISDWASSGWSNCAQHDGLPLAGVLRALWNRCGRRGQMPFYSKISRPDAGPDTGDQNGL
jgi:hypothetical protein